MANVFVRDTAEAYSLGRRLSSWPASVNMVSDSRQQLVESTLGQVAQNTVGEASSAYEYYLAPCQYVDLHDSEERPVLLCSRVRALWEVGQVESSLWLRRWRHSVSSQGVWSRRAGMETQVEKNTGRPISVSRFFMCILVSLGSMQVFVDDGLQYLGPGLGNSKESGILVQCPPAQ